MKRTRIKTAQPRTAKSDPFDYRQAAERAAMSPTYSAATSKDRLGLPSGPHVPRSFQTGAGRQHWDAIVRLFSRIRDDCDEAAQALGYTSAEDDGLAAAEYVAKKILEDARSQRRQREASRTQEARRKSGPHESTKQFLKDYDTTYSREKEVQRASASERSKWIDELTEALRLGKTKDGAIISPQLTHQIAKQITILKEGLAQPETKKTIKKVRESLAPFFAKLYGKSKKLSVDPVSFVEDKVKRAKKSVRGATKKSKRRH
jgi:hypothetical protein